MGMVKAAGDGGAKPGRGLGGQSISLIVRLIADCSGRGGHTPDFLSPDNQAPPASRLQTFTHPDVS